MIFGLVLLILGGFLGTKGHWAPRTIVVAFFFGAPVWGYVRLRWLGVAEDLRQEWKRAYIPPWILFVALVALSIVAYILVGGESDDLKSLTLASEILLPLIGAETWIALIRIQMKEKDGKRNSDNPSTS